jgi:ATP-dependent DNA helicase RecG
MTLDQIHTLIAQGEGQELQFKREQPRPIDLAKTLVAFANSQGGTVLVGVDDKGHIKGVSHWDELERRMHDVALNNCYPAVPVTIERVDAPQGTVMVIRVPQGREKPYRASNGVYYVREGGRSRAPLPNELVAMLYQSRQMAFDRTLVPGARLEHLDADKIERYVQLRRQSPRLRENARTHETFLQAMGLLDDDGAPTVAATLLFGLYPQRFLPQAQLNAFRFRGAQVDNQRIIDRALVRGTVDEMIEEGAAFVLRNSRTMSPIEGVYRRDVPEYPAGAVREALTNAVLHRDYWNSRYVTLRMFDDRLEVENPGGLVGVLSIEELLAQPRSYPRNELLLQVARDVGLVELVASGLQQIIAEVRENGSPVDPTFEADVHTFVVTLPSRWWQLQEEGGT